MHRAQKDKKYTYLRQKSYVDQLEHLILAYNDIQDRLYEIDKSWKNNLIFYGIPAGKLNYTQLQLSNPVMFLTGCPPVHKVFCPGSGTQFA